MVRLQKYGNPLRELQQNTREFRKLNKQTLSEAANIATGMSRDTFNRRRVKPQRPHVQDSPGRGRPTTMGNFERLIHWMHESFDGVDFVQFQLGRLEQDAPYWLIHEIGTGESGRLLDTSLKGFTYQGASSAAAQMGGGRSIKGPGIVSVKHQAGREISPYLAWGDAGGRAPVTGRAGQLHYYRDVVNAPMRIRPDVIRQEIEGKHYLRDGGRTGFAHVERTLFSMARNTFKHP